LNPPEERFVGVVGRLKDGLIGPERDRGAGFISGFAALDGSSGRRANIRLGPHVTITLDHGLQPGRQRVDDRNADTVKSPGHCVGLAVELSAGVQDRQNHFKSGLLLSRVFGDGDAATVIHHPDTTVGEQCHFDLGAVASKRLVDGVVDHLVHKVMQTALAGRPDIHPGSLAHRLKALKNGDGSGAVVGRIADLPLGTFADRVEVRRALAIGLTLGSNGC